jgi:hypothetical protein
MEQFVSGYGHALRYLVLDLLDRVYRENLLFEWTRCHVSSQKRLRGQYVEMIFRQRQCVVW